MLHFWYCKCVRMIRTVTFLEFKGECNVFKCWIHWLCKTNDGAVGAYCNEASSAGAQSTVFNAAQRRQRHYKYWQRPTSPLSVAACKLPTRITIRKFTRLVTGKHAFTSIWTTNKISILRGSKAVKANKKVLLL